MRNREMANGGGCRAVLRRVRLKSFVNMQIDDMQSGTGTTVNETNPSQEDFVATGRTCRVMVVDDSKTIRRTAVTLLRKEGFEVVTAVDGFEALGKIADYKPDLIFLDIMMPRLDGYQTCALIKHHHIFRNTPVVMLSSRDGLFDRARGRVVGSDRYITKPFTKEDLLAVIAHYGGNFE
jgi:twitching motility two-component system response regulator PilG